MFISLIIDLIGFTVILPLMPKLLDHYNQKGGVSVNILHDVFQHFQEKWNIPPNFKTVIAGGIHGFL